MDFPFIYPFYSRISTLYSWVNMLKSCYGLHKREVKLLLLFLLRYSKMVFQMIIWVAIWWNKQTKNQILIYVDETSHNHYMASQWTSSSKRHWTSNDDSVVGLCKNRYHLHNSRWKMVPTKRPLDMPHGLRTPNEGINKKDLKILADVADKLSFGCN